MATTKGLEPLTYRLEICYSIQLSYVAKRIGGGLILFPSSNHQKLILT